MSVNDDETWTCDRCASQAVVSRNAQPEGWRSVLTISPPKAEAQGHRQHMCPECVQALDAWWALEAGSKRTDSRPEAERG